MQENGSSDATLVSELSVSLANRRATRRLGRALAAALQAGDLVFFEGELGAGKTFLVRAVARGLGVPHHLPIQSPTFALVHEHALPRGGRLIHADLYRLSVIEELEELGLGPEDDAIVCIEWGERFRPALEPPSRGSLLVQLSGGTPKSGPRVALLFGRGPRGQALLSRVTDALARPSLAG